ncbi:MAG: hypothetical protein V7L14_12145 [Nostoc sp.]|uniref:hypothetical protein n=1 Tax=Nostoc sp. TaxID=1180 RepID=UPI002FF836A0
MIVLSTPWIHDRSEFTATKTTKYCRLYGITEAMPAVVTELAVPLRGSKLRAASRREVRAVTLVRPWLLPLGDASLSVKRLLISFHSQCFCSFLPLKTANTTRTLRFTLIAESINSYTLDRVKAN